MLDTYLVCLDCIDRKFYFEPAMYRRRLQPNMDVYNQAHIGIFLRRLTEKDQYARVTYKRYSTVQVILTTY